MKKMGNKGFSAAEGLLIVVILVLIGGIGYFVYNNRAKPQSTNSTSENQKLEDQAGKKEADPLLTTINSKVCQDISAMNTQVAQEWVGRITESQTIQQLQTDKSQTTRYDLGVGTLCELDQGYSLVTFGHTKNVPAADGTIDSTYTKGIFIYSADKKEVLVNKDAKCQKRPPDATSPVAATSVTDGVVRIVCPGYEPTQKLDLNLKTQSYNEV